MPNALLSPPATGPTAETESTPQPPDDAGHRGFVGLIIVTLSVFYVATPPAATGLAIIALVVWAVRGVTKDRRARAAAATGGAPAKSQRAAIAARKRMPGNAGAPGAGNVALDALAAALGFAAGVAWYASRDLARGERRGPGTPATDTAPDTTEPGSDATDAPRTPHNPSSGHDPKTDAVLEDLLRDRVDDVVHATADGPHWVGETVDGEVARDGDPHPPHRPNIDIDDAVIVEPRALAPHRPALPAPTHETDPAMSDLPVPALPSAEHTIFDVIRFVDHEVGVSDLYHAHAAQQADATLAELEQIRARALALVQRCTSLSTECARVDALLQRSALVVGAWSRALEIAHLSDADPTTLAALALVVQAAAEVARAQQLRREELAAARAHAAHAAEQVAAMQARTEAALAAYHAEMAAIAAYQEAAKAVSAALHAHQIPHAEAQAVTGNAAAAPGYLAGA